MSKSNSFEGLALELRQRIYFFAGFPVAKKYYGPKDWKTMLKKLQDPEAMLAAVGNPKVSMFGRLRAVYENATNPIVPYVREKDIQFHHLRRINRRLRHELLCLLFDGGLGFRIDPIYELPTTSWTSLIRLKTMDYITSAVVSIRFADTLWWENNVAEQERAGNTFAYLTACAPNLRELKLKLGDSNGYGDVCNPVTSFPSANIALYRLIRSLHHFVTINSEKHLKLIRPDWIDSIT
ncbi:hypothetical protein GRF29_106g79284 [Pseudopithomyces chartarum]|uniref:Uncharacterized protein n=1 Tax=Pseudopithomyces chartarum TaxID=1892770 RepID=A0AAN6LTP4_9PLEO|nr:hypothetical protein GRF29_106g79284 [Pseudopithomyces chartarum]